MNTDYEQLGGFSKVEFFLLKDTNNWPIVINDETASEITHIASEIDNFGIIVESSIDVNVTPKQTAEGEIYPTEIVFSFSNRTPKLEKYLDKFQNKPVVVIAKLNTGKNKLYGTNETPLIFIYKIDDGKKVEDLGVITVNIKGKTRNRAVYYNV